MTCGALILYSIFLEQDLNKSWSHNVYTDLQCCEAIEPQSEENEF